MQYSSRTQPGFKSFFSSNTRIKLKQSGLRLFLERHCTNQSIRKKYTKLKLQKKGSPNPQLSLIQRALAVNGKVGTLCHLNLGTGRVVCCCWMKTGLAQPFCLRGFWRCAVLLPTKFSIQHSHNTSFGRHSPLLLRATPSLIFAFRAISGDVKDVFVTVSPK